MTDQLVTQVQADSDVRDWCDELDATVFAMAEHADVLERDGLAQLAIAVRNAAEGAKRVAAELRAVVDGNAPQQVGQ